VFDFGFVVAIGAMGWGLSLATYRLLAARHRWPMGRWQADRPLLPVGIGAICAALAAIVAMGRISAGDSPGGTLIFIFGFGWAVFWTGFLRTGAQSALLLAPFAALLLVIRPQG
jgi:hypothetical protein